MSKQTILKPCPFCGLKRITLWPMPGGYGSPVCERCGATIHENFNTAETTDAMVKAWDRRAP